MGDGASEAGSGEERQVRERKQEESDVFKGDCKGPARERDGLCTFTVERRSMSFCPFILTTAVTPVQPHTQRLVSNRTGCWCGFYAVGSTH